MRANPADTMLDAITLECYQDMQSQGKMISLPEIDDKSSLGKGLSQLWRDNAASFENAETASPDLPSCKFQTCTFAEAILIQVRRTGKQMQRELQQLATNNLLMVFGVLCLCLLVSPGSLSATLIHPVNALFGVSLMQGIAALRLFGGAERAVGWREAGASVSMFCYFAGRDIMASLEMFLGALAFTAVYWPLGTMVFGFWDFLRVSFAHIYAVWGMSYIWSVIFDSSSAQMISVVSTFVCQLIGGLAQPDFATMSKALGKNGVYLMALTPSRWSYSAFVTYHIENHNEFTNQLVDWFTRSAIQPAGFPMSFLAANSWSCENQTSGNVSSVVRIRWQGSEDRDVPPIACVCGSRQLMLLGITYRIIARVALVATSKKKATGGAGLFVTAGHQSEASTGPMISLMLKLFCVLLIIVLHLAMMLLLQT
mmetsp:Transcript_15212/g.26619  ORF Transcript_15212/g.26619 Transcript_15212/m.26619 type:complete len:426 (-) Transcript_15212:97-1374(-)